MPQKRDNMIEQAEKVEFFSGLDPEEIRRRRCPEANHYYDLIAESLRKLDSEVNPLHIEFTDKAALTQEIKDHALRLGASLVGISETNQAYVYKGKQVYERYAISLAMEMDYDCLATAPSEKAEAEVASVYYELGEITIALARHIRGLGYVARIHHPSGAGRLLQQPFAIAAGFGELGRNGLVISKEFGPRFRLGCVTTDLPLLTDKPVKLGVAEYCINCQVCLRACPTGAIASEPRVVRGVKKYAIDGTKCRPYTLYNHGCAVCLKACVLNKLSKQKRWLKTPRQEVKIA